MQMIPKQLNKYRVIEVADSIDWISFELWVPSRTSKNTVNLKLEKISKSKAANATSDLKVVTSYM